MQVRALSILLGTLLLLQSSNVHAHVRLTSPPARFPDYDFLDNVRTGGPCGIPASSNSAPVTTFQAGSVINVTYHLAYPHRGGMMVNILAANGSILYALLGSRWQLTDDSTRFQQQVTLPGDFECEKCTLQLVRQAAEWRAPGGGYRFWSCADISIMNSSRSVCNNMTCSGNGRCEDGKCMCNRLYSGDFCQNKDECENERDCSNHGACIDIQAISFPRRQCFCDPGWFGERCSRASDLTNAAIDPTEYTLRRQLSDRLTLYARIIGNTEIEVALRLNGTSYVALGWRPRGLASCRPQPPGFFPVGRHPLWPWVQSWPSVDGADAFYNELVGIEGGSGSGGDGSVERGSAEGGSEEGGSEEGASEEGASEEGASEEGASEEGASEEGASEEGASEEGASEEGASEEGGSEEGGSEEGGSEEGGSEEGGGSEGGNAPNLHAMDCTDVVIGVARGQQFRVFDYFTRDRSTPRRDSFYEGSDSITAAVGAEIDGFTTIKWRKRLQAAGDVADHSITNQLMDVIWSFGQVYPDYFHTPASGIEAGTAQNERFYQPDEIKYHGGRNRGRSTINFFDMDDNVPNLLCQGGFRTGCIGQTCEYRASWVVRGGNVEFNISARTSDSTTQWVGIGFSSDRWMPNSDAVVGAADANGYFVTDRNIVARSQPPIDASQDITNAMATHENGITTVTFTRPLISDDPDDPSLIDCQFFFYGWGGSADTTSRMIRMHESTPIISNDRVCLPSPTECGGGTLHVISSFTLLLTCIFTILTLA